ncbi:beta-1,3-galactosyltransferase 5-like [Bacillus rossius redtenbacheri]|uniref:beta-1,3-galactosyltransferase 5-like n=1 Tax=Bacillus rossius redtenbacheri TaxID=93214 RepID=UPI002FDDBFDE
MRRYQRNIVIVMLLTLSGFFVFLVLPAPKRSYVAEEARTYYLQQFLSDYNPAPRPSNCGAERDVTAAEQEVVGRMRAARYNGTAISEVYQPGFDALPRACADSGRGVDLLVVVHSACGHADLRAAARMTWKAAASLPGVAAVFLLGRTRDRELSRRAAREAELFGDVVLSRNADTYGGLTLKSVSMAEWVARHCRRAGFVLKADDDVFLNVVRLLQLVRLPEVAASTRSFFGRLTRGAKPVRDPSSKFHVPEAEFPGDTYPDYLQGSSYLYTGDLSQDLYAWAVAQDLFRMEDVFVTGFLADVLQARRVDVGRFQADYRTVRSGWKRRRVDPCDLRSRVVVH